MKILVVIPARGGSKGLPGKNIKPLCGKPLIGYAIDVARDIFADQDICVSTDDMSIIQVVENMGLVVPFVRPSELASDTATSNDMLLHALDFYKERGDHYDTILLLQPTSPLRTAAQIKEAIELYKGSAQCDMVVSVRRSHASSVICQEDEDGYLHRSLTTSTRRQDAPDYYEYNGAIYVINVESLRQKGLSNFTKEIKYIMPAESSVDIDTLLDFQIAELILNNR